MSQIKLGFGLGVFLFLVSSFAIAETSSTSTEITSTTIPANPPVIKKSEPPRKSTYSAGEIISYQIIVQLPENGEQIRLGSQDLDLENLELLSVNQETVSSSEEIGKREQLLDFRFTAQNPGPAKIKRFTLRWIYGDGFLTSDFNLPPIELTIKASRRNFKFIILLVAILILGSASAAGFLISKKRKKMTPSILTISPEELSLRELDSVYANFDSQKNRTDFLNQLRQILEGYLRQKLDWNPVRLDYNELQKKLEEKWSKKEAKEVKELFNTLDFERFSGLETDQSKVAALYQSIHTLIERRKEI